MTPPPIKEMLMTKAELVDQVATIVDFSKSQTEAVLTQCLQTIMEALHAGESVELQGFGRFQLRHRKPQAGRNPRTGETFQIPAKVMPTFTVGKAFQEQVQPSGSGWRRVRATPVWRWRTDRVCTPAPLARARWTVSLVGDTGAPCGTWDEETAIGEGKERGDGTIHGTA
jgi:nucleoid DNA-binding protein